MPDCSYRSSNYVSQERGMSVLKKDEIRVYKQAPPMTDQRWRITRLMAVMQMGFGRLGTDIRHVDHERVQKACTSMAPT